MHDERAESWSGRETRVARREKGVTGREKGVAGREKGVAGRRAQLQWMSATLRISFILRAAASWMDEQFFFTAVIRNSVRLARAQQAAQNLQLWAHACACGGGVHVGAERPQPG